MIDHTLLKPDATRAQIVKLSREAAEYQFAAVCVNPYWVRLANEQLKGTDVKIANDIGFPLGSSSTFAKLAETRDAIAAGATEIDMVMNIGELKSGDVENVRRDIEAIAVACRNYAILKVIIETGMLTDKGKRSACRICVAAGADYVKTSTGFGPGGATAQDVSLMRAEVGEGLGVKASGGIRDLDTAYAMIFAGASRIGTSVGVDIMNAYCQDS